MKIIQQRLTLLDIQATHPFLCVCEDYGEFARKEFMMALTQQLWSCIAHTDLLVWAVRSSVVSWRGSGISLQQSSNTDFLSMNSPQPSSKATFVFNHSMTRAAFPLMASLGILAALLTMDTIHFLCFLYVNVQVSHTLKPVFLQNFPHKC